jgi:hypothetical protein
MMMISLFRSPTNQPTVVYRQRARGGKYPLISPHERSTFSHNNNPDLCCHILTSSPSFPNPVSSLQLHLFRLQYHVRWQRLVMIYLSFNPLIPPTESLGVSSSGCISTFFLPSMAHHAQSALLYLPCIVASLCLYP